MENVSPGLGPGVRPGLAGVMDDACLLPPEAMGQSGPGWHSRVCPALLVLFAQTRGQARSGLSEPSPTSLRTWTLQECPGMTLSTLGIRPGISRMG